MFRILFWDFLQTIETVFCASRNHISRGKKVKIFTFAYGQAGSGDPPYGQPDRTIPRFFSQLPKDISQILFGSNNFLSSSLSLSLSSLLFS